MKNLVTKLQRLYNENFIVSRCGRIAVVFNACSKSTQDWLLAAGFGMENADETYNFIMLIKTLGEIYSSVNHAVVAQQELGRGRKQERESHPCVTDVMQWVMWQTDVRPGMCTVKFARINDM